MLKEREAQILAITEDQRDEYLDGESEHNPILFAETGPNRFHLMSLFFSDNDGVQIQEDADLGEITIKYFKDDEADVELTDGPVYDWALQMYKAW